eukprot:3437622-Heterocapsa_arctica.AAC.1
MRSRMSGHSGPRGITGPASLPAIPEGDLWFPAEGTDLGQMLKSRPGGPEDWKGTPVIRIFEGL